MDWRVETKILPFRPESPITYILSLPPALSLEIKIPISGSMIIAKAKSEVTQAYPNSQNFYYLAKTHKEDVYPFLFHAAEVTIRIIPAHNVLNMVIELTIKYTTCDFSTHI